MTSDNVLIIYQCGHLTKKSSSKIIVQKLTSRKRWKMLEWIRSKRVNKPFSQTQQNRGLFKTEWIFFFTDYSLIPLLVAEKYLSVRPNEFKGNTKKEKDLSHLISLSESAESICQADRIGKILRSEKNSCILTSQSIFATVTSGEKL